MKIKCLLFLLLIVFNAKYVGQVNLVMNPSFETYTACPTLSGDVNKAIGWDAALYSPDYFHECSPITQAQTPLNYFGYQSAKNGSAYCGFYSFDASTLFYREILIGTLSQSLVPNQKYFVTFYVSRADSNYLIGYSTNNIGVKFTKVKQIATPINNTAHIFSNVVITDTVNWTKISGSFVADSSYSYIMFGNFFDNTNSIISNDGNGNIAYYYIDEICVSTDSLYAENYITTGFVEHNHSMDIKIFPNPANSDFEISGIEKNEIIKVFDNLGNLKFKESNVGIKKLKINCESWNSGLYFVITTRYSYKLIINH